MTMFSHAAYASVRRPLTEATPLPGWCYSSPQWHEREMERVFAGPSSDWLCVGRIDQVPNPGDFHTVNLVGRPIIVVRDNANEVKVLSAVCRHRGAVICEGKGRSRTFVCPYHGWTYALDGELLHVPGSLSSTEAAQTFDKADYGLDAIRSEVWAGFIFVTFAENPQPLLEKLGQLPKFVENYDFDELRFTRRTVHEGIGTNWKGWLENGLENYHVMSVHRRHANPSVPQNWVIADTDGSFEAVYSSRSIAAYSEADRLPKMAKLDRDQSVSLYHVWVPPNLHLVLTPAYIRCKQHLPLGPDRFTLIEDWAFPRTTLENPEFAKQLDDTSGFYDKHTEIFAEDLSIGPNVQRGVSSGLYRPGRFDIEEYIVHRIANYIVDRVTDRPE